MPCHARSVRRQRSTQTPLAARVARHGRAVSGDYATASFSPALAPGPNAPALGPLTWLLTTQRLWQAVMVHALAYGAQRSPNRFEVEFDRGDDPERGFRRAAAGVRAWVRLRGLTEDASRVDYRASMAMLGAGWSEAQVRAGMIAGSDDLAARHTDPDDYVRRTVNKASIELATRQASAASAPL